MSSSSFGSSSSSSTSTPTVVRTPENDMLDAISQYASGLASQMNNWAQGVFAQTSAITDQAVGNFFQTAQKMSNFAQGLTDQYNNLFAPENAQLIQDANTYASEPRMRANMGMAGATQAQAGDQALRNSEQQLLSYGIDPSAGRYAALDKAAAVQNAANVAGAENVQRNADIATGQKLRSEAVQVGSLLPSAVTNASNTAIQANTGASNASLANANTGANLMSLADKYLQTAMGLKLPLMGQNSQSHGSSSNQSSSQNPNNSGSRGSGGGGGGGYDPYGNSGPAWMPQHGGTGGGGNFSGGSGYNHGPGSEILHPGEDTGGGDTSGGQITDPQLGQDPGGWGGSNFDQWTNPSDSTTFGGGGYDQGTFGDLPSITGESSWGNITYDPSQNQSQVDTGAGSGWGDYSGTSDPSVFDTGSSSIDNYGGAGSFDDFGSGDYSSGFAMGGSVPMYAGGGQVPVSASPSGGRQVDDVPAQMPNGAPARLNAEEFVMPRDVAKWKGQEFFHKLIAQSRANMAQMQARTGAAPKPMVK